TYKFLVVSLSTTRWILGSSCSVAWLIGWALILEYTIGGSTVARGISPNLAMIFGGEDCLPAILARHQIPGLDIVVDPCAAVLVFIVTGLLCIGVKESTFAQGIITTVNVFVMIFVIVAGSYLCFKTGWAGYQLPSGYFPYGVDGMLAGSATVFFAYIGFDSVASMAEEVKNPQRDLPLGIGLSLLLCCLLYMMVSVVIVGLVPYYAMDPDTPISSAFATHGIQWAAYLIALGAVMALCSTLMGSILPQVPLPSSLQERICSAPFLRCEENSSSHVSTSISTKQPLLCEPDDSTVEKKEARWGWVLSKENRRKFAGWSIMFICIGNFLISYAASSLLLPGLLRYSLCGVGGLLLLSGLIVLSCIDQDDARHSFGHSGGFICPLVPLLPILCILINMYLLVNLGAGTWARVSVWLFIGVLVYVFYGRRHSSLANAFYVTTAHADEIGRSSGYSLA
ncbi:hypothetical protein F2Q68_00026749, partial [Brassica cretica]